MIQFCGGSFPASRDVGSNWFWFPFWLLFEVTWRRMEDPRTTGKQQIRVSV